MMRSRYLLTFALLALLHTVGSTAEVLVEAESFEQHGGWQLDTQFITEMGSPYLLAHGLGRPVEDATTEFQVDEAGEYIVWVRTYDWVARWDAPGSPGRFRIRIDNQELANDLGTAGKDWSWHRAGQVELTAGTHSMQLQDLTGFDGPRMRLRSPTTVRRCFLRSDDVCWASSILLKSNKATIWWSSEGAIVAWEPQFQLPGWVARLR